MITRADLPRLQSRKKYLIEKGRELCDFAESEGRHFKPSERTEFDSTLTVLAEINTDLEVARAAPRRPPMSAAQMTVERRKLNAALREMGQPQHASRSSRTGGRASNSSRESTAYHEAGHVILARADGHRIEWVSINKSGGGSTYFRNNGVLGLRSPASTLAGPIAARMAGFRTKSWGTHMDRARDQARMCLQYRSAEGRSIDTLLDQEETRARDVLHRHWTEVQRLAAALLARGRIEGAEVSRVLGLSSNNYGPRAA